MADFIPVLKATKRSLVELQFDSANCTGKDKTLCTVVRYHTYIAEILSSSC